MKKLLLLTCLIFSSYNILAIEDDYPKSRQERQADEIGSIAGDEGLVFRPGKIKNESTKSIISPGVNKYLWQASIEMLDSVPLASVDSPTGSIISDWYNVDENKRSKNRSNHNSKVNILIKDNVIAPSAIEIKVFEREKINGRWVQNANNTNLANSLEEKIIRRAREIYIDEMQQKPKKR